LGKDAKPPVPQLMKSERQHQPPEGRGTRKTIEEAAHEI